MLTFIKKIVLGQKKLYLGILIILSLLTSFEFVAIAMYSASNQFSALPGSPGFVLKVVTGIIIMIAFALTMLVNNYLINLKTEEFSLILLCGMRLKKIIGYILMQFGLLFLLAYILGFIIGIGWIELYKSIYQGAITGTLNDVVYVFVVLFMVKMLMIVVLDMGKFIRIKMDIAGYMNHQPTKLTNASPFKMITSGIKVNKDKHKKLNYIPIGKILSSLIGVLLVFIGLTPMFQSVEGANLAGYFTLSLMGEIYIVNTTIPLTFDILHNNVLLKSKNWLISLSNLKDLISVMIAMINISAIVVPIIIGFLALNTMVIPIQNAMMTSFLALMAAMFLCFIIRFMIYLPTRATQIATLRALGFNKKRIKKIHNQEIILFIILIVLFPILMYGTLLYKSYLMGMVTYNTFITMIAIYIVLYLVMSIYMIYSYHQLIKEVYNDVRYLNQSE